MLYARLPQLISGEPLPITMELAHELIWGGIEYAARYGFRPDPDFKLAQLVVDPPEAHPRTGAVTFGKDGKPFYVSGPHDNVRRHHESRCCAQRAGQLRIPGGD